MPRPLKLSLLGLAVLFGCMPPAFFLTIFLAPLWSWVESKYGIESIGHSGPADWCFYLIYGILSAAAMLAIALHLRPGKAKVI
jgi:hypothetical protein